MDEKSEETHYGYKEHVKVDADSKLFLDYAITPANVLDSNKFDDLFNKQDEVGYADSANIGKKLPQHVRNEVFENCYRSKTLTKEQKENNRLKNQDSLSHQSCVRLYNHVHARSDSAFGIECAMFHIGLTNLVYNLFRYAFSN